MSKSFLVISIKAVVVVGIFSISMLFFIFARDHVEISKCLFYVPQLFSFCNQTHGLAYISDVKCLSILLTRVINSLKNNAIIRKYCLSLGLFDSETVTKHIYGTFDIFILFNGILGSFGALVKFQNSKFLKRNPTNNYN